jgi:putative ABC transport system substrate-binding protein
MRRRKFIVCSAAVAAWPLVARAQQARMPTIGYLCPQTPAAFVSRLAAFRQGLEESEYVEGRNVAIEFRWADGQHDKLKDLATDLVSRQVDLIVAPGGAPAAIAAKSATTSIPIVFEMGADPIAIGLVDSLSRPSGNITGISSLSVEVTSKRLEYLRRTIPSATSIAVLVNPTSPTANSQLASLRTMISASGLQLHILHASAAGELEAVSASLLKLRPEGLVFTSDTFFGTNAELFAGLAVRHKIPAIHQSRDFVIAGGLMSYGGSFLESHRQAGIYAGQVLKGAKPADLPVRQVSKLEFLINFKTAKALGIKIPTPLAVLADIAIE